MEGGSGGRVSGRKGGGGCVSEKREWGACEWKEGVGGV